MEAYDTWFSRRLVTEYLHAIHDDKLLIKIEGSARYMTKPDEELLLEERMEGEAIGEARGEARGIAIGEARGKEQGVIISIKVINALRANEPIESIAENLKISVEEIRQIQSVLPVNHGLSA